MNDDKFIINPSKKQLENSPLNLVLSVAPNKNISNIQITSTAKSFSRFLIQIK